jgi:hypothetical protein
MKLIAIVLLGLLAAGCMDGRGSAAFVTVTSPGAPQLRFEGFEGPYSIQMSPTGTVITYGGRTIQYAEGALLINNRRLPLPSGTRVIEFDGAQIYFDGRSVDSL